VYFKSSVLGDLAAACAQLYFVLIIFQDMYDWHSSQNTQASNINLSYIETLIEVSQALLNICKEQVRIMTELGYTRIVNSYALLPGQYVYESFRDVTNAV
jgi:hypothetical protein